MYRWCRSRADVSIRRARRDLACESRCPRPIVGKQMLFVAMSCLQGRPMAHAFDELAQLGVGIQLTPGNLPTDGFRDHVAASGIATRSHHGFSFEHRKTTVWSSGACVVDSESVHPPATGEGGHWRTWYERADRPLI